MSVREFDGQAVRQIQDPELEELYKQFVCVRRSQVGEENLKELQFDFSLGWSLIVMNADGTVYTRFGSRGREDSLFRMLMRKAKLPRRMTIAGLKSTLKTALAMHKKVTAEGESGPLHDALAGKVVPAWEYTSPKALMPPGAKPCMDCHEMNIGRFLAYRRDGKTITDRMLWSYPVPDSLGVILDPDERGKVKTVRTGSEAQRAGLKRGDEIITMADQPILSEADAQWVLQHAPDGEDVTVKVRRKGETKLRKLKLSLTEGWRRRGGESAWKMETYSTLGHLGFGRFTLNDLTSIQRRGLRLKRSELGIHIMAGSRGASKQLQVGDIIVGVKGVAAVKTSAELAAYIIREAPAESTLALRVLRKNRRMDVAIKIKSVPTGKGQ